MTLYTADTNKQAEVFLANGTLFYRCNFKNMQNFLRVMTNDFGILLYLKLDENQSECITRFECEFPSVVLSTFDQLEVVGAFLEASAYESTNNIVPVYYETILKDKITRDEDFCEMINLIFSVLKIELGDTYWCGQVCTPIMQMIDSKRDIE